MNRAFKTEAGMQAVHAAYREILAAWPVPHDELRLPTRQGETFVVACGPKHAPPVLALHGAQANAAAYMFDATVWSGHFRVYAVDMIGESGFSAPARPPLDSDAYALWLDDVMNGLGIERAALVGVSLGGWLALDYATRRPDRVERLALMCPAGIGRQKNFLLKAAPLLLLGPWGPRKIREMVFGKAPLDPPPIVRRFSDFMALIGRHARPRIIRIPHFSDEALQRLTMPVLAIMGGRDVLLDLHEAKVRLEKNVPHADIRFLPEARHYIPGQSQAMLDFLRAGTVCVSQAEAS